MWREALTRIISRRWVRAKLYPLSSRLHLPLSGVNFMEKTISVRRTTITFSIWDLGGQREFVNMLPLVCNDAVAILFMFDLSRKSTLNSVKEWYRQARGFNKVSYWNLNLVMDCPGYGVVGQRELSAWRRIYRPLNFIPFFRSTRPNSLIFYHRQQFPF